MSHKVSSVAWIFSPSRQDQSSMWQREKTAQRRHVQHDIFGNVVGKIKVAREMIKYLS